MLTLIVIINLVLTIALMTQLSNTHHHIVEHIDRTTRSLKQRIIMSTQELINEITTQLRKAAGEIQSKIADLNVQITDAGVADQVDLTELTAAAQALDDIVPDAENNPPF